MLSELSDATRLIDAAQSKTEDGRLNRSGPHERTRHFVLQDRDGAGFSNPVSRSLILMLTHISFRSHNIYNFSANHIAVGLLCFAFILSRSIPSRSHH